MRGWKGRWSRSLVTISSGIGSPDPVVMTRRLPSTVDATMPGNHSWMRAGSPTRDHTASAGRLIRTWRRTLPRAGVMVLLAGPTSPSSSADGPAGGPTDLPYPPKEDAMPTMSRFEATVCRSAPWRLFAGRVVLPWALQGVTPGGDVLEIGAG